MHYTLHALDKHYTLHYTFFSWPTAFVVLTLSVMVLEYLEPRFGCFAKSWWIESVFVCLTKWLHFELLLVFFISIFSCFFYFLVCVFELCM